MATDPDTVHSDGLETPIGMTSNQSEPMDNFEQEEEIADSDFARKFETESEGVDYTPFSSNEDQEKLAAYNEYKHLEKNIKHQNEILENLKKNIQTMHQRKDCLNKSEKNELKIMYELWEKEMRKLQELVSKALNSSGSKRHYRELSLVTTFDEDILNQTERTFKTLQDQSSVAHNKTGNYRAAAGESSEMNTSCTDKESQINISEEKKLMKHIFAAIKEMNCLKGCKKQKQSHSLPCNEQQSFQEIKNKVKSMQEKICEITEELNTKDNLQGSHQSYQKPICTDFDLAASLCKDKGKSNNAQQLKDNYLYLLTEFTKKDEQLKDLAKKLKRSCSKCAGGVGDSYTSDESEIQLLRDRLKEMREEQIEFKCLMKEQSFQLEEYRNKYLTAQQKVEEQTALLEKQNMNNKCIEKQINLEIKQIRAKFQERISDLLQFPKLLENEQIKLAKTCKEKEELENKLIIVCKELKTLKLKAQNNNTEDYKPQLLRCQQELNQVKKNIQEIQNQRDMFCEQLRSTKDDLDLLRSESARIIARTKERTECIKQQQQEQIDRLEKQLAQCRATACLSVSDREAVIKEMQGQLNTLSYNFDAAQKQIKTLRNHIAFMSNENSFPAKCL